MDLYPEISLELVALPRNFSLAESGGGYCDHARPSERRRPDLPQAHRICSAILWHRGIFPTVRLPAHRGGPTTSPTLRLHRSVAAHRRIGLHALARSDRICARRSGAAASSHRCRRSRPALPWASYPISSPCPTELCRRCCPKLCSAVLTGSRFTMTSGGSSACVWFSKRSQISFAQTSAFLCNRRQRCSGSRACYPKPRDSHPRGTADWRVHSGTKPMPRPADTGEIRDRGSSQPPWFFLDRDESKLNLRTAMPVAIIANLAIQKITRNTMPQ